MIEFVYLCLITLCVYSNKSSLPKKQKDKKTEASIPNNNNKVLVPTIETGATTALSLEVAKGNKECEQPGNTLATSNLVKSFVFSCG